MATLTNDDSNSTLVDKTEFNVGQLRDWLPISADGSRNSFIAVGSDDRKVEVRYLDWIQSETLAGELSHQVKLAKVIGDPIARRVLSIQSKHGRTQLVLENLETENSEPSSLTSLKETVEANQILTTASYFAEQANHALLNGLIHGNIEPDTVEIDQNLRCRLDYLWRFQCEDNYRRFEAKQNEVFEQDAAGISKIIALLLQTLTDSQLTDVGVVGKRKAELKSLLRSAQSPSADITVLQRLVTWLAPWRIESAKPSAESDANLQENAAELQWQQPRQKLEAPPVNEANDRTLNTVIQSNVGDSLADCDTTSETAILSSGREHETGFSKPELGQQLGRFRLDSQLGEGGMGIVFRGVDLTNNEPVAVKVLKLAGNNIGHSIRRFNKEAKMLAGVQNANVTRLIDFGVDNGHHYMAMEFVDGVSLKQWLSEQETLDEKTCLELLAELAQALVEAHDRGIVHRDIKPENILLTNLSNENAIGAKCPRVRLTDFGIARQIQQSVSMEVTRAGTILGTPLFMSPEQCKGAGDITPASDIYSLGVTFYQLLCGTTPFDSNDPMRLAAMHCFDPPPAIQRRLTSLSDSTANLVHRMLAKDPAKRFANAGQLLRECERILEGKPQDFDAHPKIPQGHQVRLWERKFQWDMKSSAKELWPHVSNTDRLNRAVGLPSVNYETKQDPELGLRKFGSFRLAGVAIKWEEHPFEWVEGSRMGILREFETGPFQWFMSTVQLESLADGGCRLHHCVKIMPRNYLGRVISTIEAGWKGGRALDRVYRRIDESIQSGKNMVASDPFEPCSKLSKIAQQRLDQRLERMIELGVEPIVAEELCHFLSTSPAPTLNQIRPVELAENLGLAPEALIDACLVAASCDLLTLRWDILCPTCRVSASNEEILSSVGTHTRCEACDIEFQSNLGNAIEMVFRVHPEIRETDDAQYCIGGPEHSPHVVSQVRLAPAEKLELDLELDAGDYLIRCTRMPGQQVIRVRGAQLTSRLQIALSRLGSDSAAPTINVGPVSLRVNNDTTATQLFRIERAIDRTNIVTAAAASAIPRFRELFPEQVFDKSIPVATDQVTLLCVAINNSEEFYDEVGDQQAYEIISKLFDEIKKSVEGHRGAVVTTDAESVFCSFCDSGHALRAAFMINQELRKMILPHPIQLGVAIHRGRTLVSTQNGRLDYFGSAMRLTRRLAGSTQDGIQLSESVFSDPGIQAIVKESEYRKVMKNIAFKPKNSMVVQELLGQTKHLEDRPNTQKTVSRNDVTE